MKKSVKNTKNASFTIETGAKDNGNGSVFFIKSDLWVTNFAEFTQKLMIAGIRIYGSKVEGKYQPLCVSIDRTTKEELTSLVRETAIFGEKPVKVSTKKAKKASQADEIQELKMMLAKLLAGK